jgi:hypothetical protein
MVRTSATTCMVLRRFDQGDVRWLAVLPMVGYLHGRK